MSARKGVAELARFYRDVCPQDAVSEDEDGDMMLFQWGQPWRRESISRARLTRQLIFPSNGEQDIRHLEVQFDFSAQDLGLCESGNEWCDKRADLPEFWAFIEESEPLRPATGKTPLQITLAAFAV